MPQPQQPAPPVVRPDLQRRPQFTRRKHQKVTPPVPKRDSPVPQPFPPVLQHVAARQLCVRPQRGAPLRRRAQRKGPASLRIRRLLPPDEQLLLPKRHQRTLVRLRLALRPTQHPALHARTKRVPRLFRPFHPPVCRVGQHSVLLPMRDAVKKVVLQRLRRRLPQQPLLHVKLRLREKPAVVPAKGPPLQKA